MKKIVLMLIISLFLLSGCSQGAQETHVDNPYEIAKGTQILSYYDKEENIKISGFQVLENTLQNFQDKNNNILVNDDGTIRCITITDETVKTYQSISVGDSVSKIEDAYEYEGKTNNLYSVLFHADIEENPANQNREDDWLLIFYYTDGSQITAIQIFDVKYGREFR